GARVEREQFAPGRGHVHRAVHDQRLRLLAALGIEIEVPGELQILHRGLVDRREGTEALLVVGAAVREPIGVVSRGGLDALVVDWRRNYGSASQQRAAN